MTVLADAGSRLRAVTDFRANLVVTAGAGTGKTSLLVERILNACLGEGFELTSIVAITFTEKAAAEMRDRLSGRLESILQIASGRGSPGPAKEDEATRSLKHLRSRKGIADEEIVRRALIALRQMDEVMVGTIHSFCADLLRRYARAAEIDPLFRVDEGSARRPLLDTQWEEWLREELGGSGSREALWKECLGRFGPGDLREMAMRLAGMLALPDRETIEAQDRLASDAIGSQCRELAGQIEAARRQATGMNRNMEKHLEVCREHLLIAAERGAANLPEEIPFPTNSVPTGGRSLSGLPAADLKALAARARKLLVDCQELDPITDRCLDLLLPFVGRFRDRFAAEGYLSFNDLMVRARDLLRDHPEVRKREAGRIRSLLVDEFQDTDPLQYEILFFLSEEKETDAAGKLFIVGDPKQSIYRFRGADIEAFQDAMRRITADGGGVLSLTSNFRSPEEILSPLNHLFETAFLPASPVQARYEKIAAARGKEGSSPRVEIWSVRPGPEKENVDRRRRREGEAIAGWIQRQVQTGPLQYRQIAILFRAMTAVNLYLRPLREAGIPFVVEGGRTFGNKPEVRQFLSLLKVLVNPNDGTALLAVLRSPLGGAPDTELARHAIGGGGWTLETAADPAGCPNIARTLEKLRELRDAIRSLPADRAVQVILHETDLVELNAAAYEGAQRVANLFKIADRVAQRARDEHLSLEETVRGLEAEFEEENTDPESPLADEALDAVRVLTVHKAKGLEFPAVIIPDLGRGSPPAHDPRVSIDRVRIGGGREAIAIRIGSGANRAINAAAILDGEISRLREEAERIRTFYVACTRARENLFLVASPAARSAPWTDCLKAWGYSWKDGDPPAARDFFDGAVGHVTDFARKSGSAVQSGAFPIEEINRAVERFREAKHKTEQVRNRKWLVSPSGLREAQEESSGSSYARGGAGTGRAAAGIAVHHLLQTWDRSDPGWFRTHSRAAARYGALQTGAASEKVEAIVEEILERFLASDLPRQFKGLDLIGREIPIEAPFEGQMVRGSIDLLYRHEQTIVVADFKTDECAPGKEARLLEKYEDQLMAYARAVQQAIGLAVLPAREIWSIRTGCIARHPGTGQAERSH